MNSLVYSTGIMETVLNDDLVYYYTLREIPADVESLGRRVLEAFDVRERFFHFEFFRQNGTGDLLALEVNMRPPGGLTTDMFNYACDIDIYDAWASIIAGKGFPYPDYTHKYYCCYVGRKSNRVVCSQRAGNPLRLQRQDLPPRIDQRCVQRGAGELRLPRPLARAGRNPLDRQIYSGITYVNHCSATEITNPSVENRILSDLCG